MDDDDKRNGSRTMISLLERIADRLDSFESGTNRRLEALQQGQAITNQRLEAVEQRLDNMLQFLGAHHADHEQRLRALEERVFAKSG